MRYVSVDPGKMTGIVVYDTVKNSLGSWEYDWNALCEFAGRTPAPNAIIVERFVIGAQTLRKTQAPWSLEVTGVMRYLAHHAGATFTLSGAGDAKRFANDDLLRAYDVRPRGGHARDAMRHLLLFLAVKEGMDALDGARDAMKELGW